MLISLNDRENKRVGQRQQSVNAAGDRRVQRLLQAVADGAERRRGRCRHARAHAGLRFEPAKPEPPDHEQRDIAESPAPVGRDSGDLAATPETATGELAADPMGRHAGRYRQNPVVDDDFMAMTGSERASRNSISPASRPAFLSAAGMTSRQMRAWSGSLSSQPPSAAKTGKAATRQRTARRPRLSQDHGLRAIQQDPVLDVKADGAGEDDVFDVGVRPWPDRRALRMVDAFDCRSKPTGLCPGWRSRSGQWRRSA